MKAYIANGLFSESDRDFNNKLVTRLRSEFPKIDFYLPQENIGINDKSKTVSSIDIAIADMTELRASDFLIAVLDGNIQDPGTCCEVGIACGLNMPIIGINTDIRFNNDSLKEKMELLKEDVFENPIAYINLFVLGIVKENGVMVGSIERLVEELHGKMGKNC